MESSRQNTRANLTPAAHACGESLRLLESWLADLPQELALDLGRGACYVRDTIPEMTMRGMESDPRRTAPSAATTDIPYKAESLPYADSTFTLVTCLSAAQYISDVTAMIQEASRVLTPGGAIALIDTLTDPEPKIARAVNTIEAFRDHRHRWAYSLPDWEVFFHLAGIVMERSAVIEERQDLDEWGASAGMDGTDLLRLRALVLNGPAVVKNALKPLKRGLSVTFTQQKIVLLGRKTV